jgi:DNA modification methylase
MPYDITRTELVWPGKYDENGRRRETERISMPFQVIERVNESRAKREANRTRGLTLFEFWEGDTAETFEEGWRNKLIWGDNKLVMASLLEQFSGKIDLIYLDPPFATGANFNVTTVVGDSEVELEKEQSLIEEVAYRDTWGFGEASYLAMIAPRLELARDLLASEGTLFLHCDYRLVHDLRALLDETFGVDRFENEIIWCYSIGGKSPKRFGRKHDTILFYSRSGVFPFNPNDRNVVVPRKPNSHMKVRRDADGREYQEKIDSKSGKAYRYYLDEGKAPEDYWTDIEQLNWEDGERAGYATQKPERLLRRIIASATGPGALIADFFIGSGTTAVAAEKLGRRWIGCDLGRYAVHLTRKRLLDISECKPFEVLNLGKYERKYWQVATFGEDLDDDGVISLYEYIAFILKLYGASPAAGMQYLHGKKERAFVHVGAVDSPVTINEIKACIEECIALKAKELHILGWEWEMGLHDPIEKQAAAHGVQLVLRQIPREVMEQQTAVEGDIEFFELAYLDVSVLPTKRKNEVVVHLDNFVIPNPELVPDAVREKVRKWSDYVDYWAVDWNFSEDTFHQGWVAYRTRKDRSLHLASDPHTYGGPGEYAVMVKVIDIFGNDTSKICQVRID